MVVIWIGVVGVGVLEQVEANNIESESEAEELDIRLFKSIDSVEASPTQVLPESIDERLKGILGKIRNICWKCHCLDGYPSVTATTHSLWECRSRVGCLGCRSPDHGIKNCPYKSSTFHRYTNIARSCKYCKLPKSIHPSAEIVSKNDCKTGGMDNTLPFISTLFQKRQEMLVGFYGVNKWSDLDSFIQYVFQEGVSGYTRLIDLLLFLFQ
jgi:hypothetical protein